MARRQSLTRSESCSSHATTMSNINVALPGSSSSVAEHNSPSPTPATSVTDGSAADDASVKREVTTTSRDASVQPELNGTSSRRSVRSRASVESYNLAKLSGLHQGKQIARVKQSRSFSGDTLINDAISESPGQRRQQLEGEVEKALQMDWQVGELGADVCPAPEPSANTNKRKSASLSKIVKAAGKLSSALGKRSRDSVDAKAEVHVQSTNKQSSRRRSSDKRDVVVQVRELDEEQEPDHVSTTRPEKKRRLLDTIVEITSSLGRSTSVKKQKKTWLTQGLYCGQHADCKDTLTAPPPGGDVLPAPRSAAVPMRRHMPLPMFSAGKRESDFHLPFDVFAPLRRKEHPKEWKKLSKNSFTPSAKEVWRTKKLERSMCLCSPPTADADDGGCGENCLNRTMLYECDENNCALGPELCTNRAFADLLARTKKGNEFDIGVEIINTKECGHGLRANRSFAPGQIVIEYCGEVITQEESDRRMHEIYQDKKVSCGSYDRPSALLTRARHTI
ncbi:hypothetical protein ANO11243_012940 [Dothideomycetidae sp. 11243]|nr:hypothetical protein ANO11243_012940 [fungal sp. No.11243]